MQKEIIMPLPWNPGFKHGKSHDRIYRIWKMMKHRCSNKNYSQYKDYGGRGISFCNEWNKFENFYKDMGDPPSKDFFLDRIDNNGNYYKSNCKWSTRIEQQNNTRRTRFLILNNEKKSIPEWSRFLGLKQGTIHRRLERDWSEEESLSLI